LAEPHVVILGAGPAGLGAAVRLRESGRARVTVLERQPVPGGNAGSFEFAGLRVDYGSHRLHPACDPVILADIRSLLGDDLLDRPRHGRIGLRGRWVHFPLHPVDLLLRLDRGFALGVTRDLVAKPFRSRQSADTFGDVLQANLGPTICSEFYFPYARKIWGTSPFELSGIQARRRVSAGSFAKLARKALSQVPGLKPPGAGRFYYPRRGFGQISEAYAARAERLGAELLFSSRATRLTPPAELREGWRIEVEQAGEPRTIEADHLWSTIPIPALTGLVAGGVPAKVRQAAEAMEYRAMLLVFLALDAARFTEYDAHYLPAADVRITRLSEPKNYAAASEPRGRTVLCAELPCSPDDPCWQMDDRELAALVEQDLRRAGLALAAPPAEVHVRRLRQAYPIYRIGYERALTELDAWAVATPRLLTYGRQGLFAHDNTHHALAMGYAAAECLSERGFDEERWKAHRAVFETHVVED
jgi:protoporphyrinogen oxidase